MKHKKVTPLQKAKNTIKFQTALKNDLQRLLEASAREVRCLQDDITKQQMKYNDLLKKYEDLEKNHMIKWINSVAQLNESVARAFAEVGYVKW